MLTQVKKWGNSFALKIPKAIVSDAKIERDSFIDINIVKGQITIENVTTQRSILDELLAGITKDNLHNEIDSGSPIGNEIW
uniref:Transcriptional regulator/antitoxin, MazE n=1 Tax=Chlorobium chlorochromatii (strain CaD3) TaxID=340177 RepID=Q3ATH4_CHLCH